MQPATLHRHTDRALYDTDTITSVFASTLFAHVAYTDEGGYPHCVPMIALYMCLSEDENEQPAVYLHGHPTTKLMEMVKRREKFVNVTVAGVKKGEGRG
ncbi:hypothetical protein G7Y89_g6413 [Cudoniella acicularis]|uniref:Uncharacterized protein n=1 Tax=Cudoniella acicularis TaxID=354080 RepID=A0A8H4W2G5_9HELO|nr:hypothetical protein G7Y89_g6413 [Cudoniella acicularis]